MEINKPKKPHIDFAFCDDAYPVCNEFLFKLWKREIFFLPSYLCYPILRLNLLFDKIIDGSKNHIASSQNSDRDIFNTLDQTKPKIKLKNLEIKKGDEYLLKNFGIKNKDKIICLIVRDNKYLKTVSGNIDFSYHDYRHTDINKFNKSIKSLVDLDYFVFRMGVNANKPINIKHPKIIDYAYKGMRTDFMDVYLAQRCSFCISTSTGYDALPLIFRKPICFITVPVGLLFTFSDKFISITKNHYSKKLNRFLTLNEIFDYDLSISKKKNDFELKDIELVENTEDEINSLVLEMHHQLNDKENVSIEEKKMQDIFWKQY